MRRKEIIKMEENRILTQEIQLSLKDKKIRANDHIFITASKEEDITRHYLLPNILQGNSNYVIADRGGHIYKATEKYLTEQGYGVQILDFMNPQHSIHYNPFQGVVDGERVIRGYSKGYEVAIEGPETRHEARRVAIQVEDRKVRGDGGEKGIMAMVNTFLLATESMSNSQDAGFKICEKFLLQALAFAVAEIYEKERRDFWKIIELLQGFRSGRLGELMNDLQCKNFSSKSVRNYRLFEMSAGPNAHLVADSLDKRLQVFENDAIRELMRENTLDFDLLGEDKRVLIIVLPEEDERFQFAASILVQQVDEKMRAYTERECEGYCLSIPLTMVIGLDYANLISDFGTQFGTSRKYNIGYNIISSDKSFDWKCLEYECDNRLIFGEGKECTWIARGAEPFVGTKYEISGHPKYTE